MIATTGGRVDKDYWAFSDWLAQLYTKFTGRYTLDAMEHPFGLSKKANRYCSEINSVFSHDVTRERVWCNPAFTKICRFIKFMKNAYFRSPSNTSVTLLLPVWHDHQFWSMLAGFRIIDVIDAGNEMFETLDYWNNNGQLISRGPTRWPIMILYLGPHFEISRLSEVRKYAGDCRDVYVRIKKVVQSNLLLTDVPKYNQDMIQHVMEVLYGTKGEEC